MPDDVPNQQYEFRPSESEGSLFSAAEFVHDLNNLLDGSLRTIRSVLASLETGSPNELSSKLQNVRHALEQMASNLESAMAWDDSGVVVPGDQTPLLTAVEQLMRSLQPLADTCDVVVTSSIDAEAATVPIDRLGPVLLNGIRNAIDAAAASTTPLRTVDIVVRIHSGELRITIADSGPGIDQTKPLHISDKPGGHGIGLGLSKRLVEEMQGKLRLTNLPYSKGAILEISVPLYGKRAA